MARQKQTGLFRREGSPYWWISYTNPVTGKRVRVSAETIVREKAIQLLEQKKGESWDRKHTNEPVTWTVIELLEWAKQTVWIDIVAKRSPYLESTLKPVIEEFGIYPAVDVGIEEILKYRKKRLKAGVSNATMKQPLIYLSAAYEAAINCGRLHSNPVYRARKTYKHLFPASGTRHIALDSRQQAILIEACRGRGNYESHAGKGCVNYDILQKIVMFALRTGMRQGEILRLAWTDVDLDNMQMKTWSQKGKDKKRKERFVPILPDVHEILKQLPRSGKTIFAYEDGRPLGKHSVVHTTYQRVIRELSAVRPEFNGFDFHGLRHSFITEMLTLGANILAVGKIVGHANSVMTERYGHLSQSKLVVEMNLLPRLKIGKECHNFDTLEKVVSESI